MDEWQIAGGGKRRSQHRAGNCVGSTPTVNAPAATPAANTAEHNAAPTARQIQRCTESILEAKSEVALSKFYSNLKAQLAAARLARGSSDSSSNNLPQHTEHAGEVLLKNVKQIVVYGLGSLEQPGAVHIRYQLALATMLVELCDAAVHALAFDPVFSRLDKSVLPALGINIIEENEQGRRVATQPTLFFMPHCEAELINNLLEANIAAKTLHNVAILGNSLHSYAERWALPSIVASAKAAGRQPPHTLLQVCKSGAVEETFVDECGFPVVSAFNDTSLQIFVNDWEQRLLSLSNE